MRRNDRLIQVIFLPLLIVLVPNTSASVPLSTAAQNLMEPLSFLTRSAFDICYIFALMLLVATITQYREYRQNPGQTPLSRPVILLILTIVTALIPWIAHLSTASELIAK